MCTAAMRLRLQDDSGRALLRLALILLALLGAPDAARAITPTLDLVLPRGGRCGTRETLVLHGRHLEKPLSLFLVEPGIRVESIRGLDANRVEVVIAIAPDCPLGRHALRLRTATGVSELRTFHVGELVGIPEREPNDDPGHPQVVSFLRTIDGVLKLEDVDRYRFEVKPGERVSAEVECLRLATMPTLNALRSGLVDTRLTLYDEAGVAVADCDDHALLGQDSALSYVSKKGGRYTLVLTDATRDGHEQCLYRLHIGRFPRPALLFPPGGRPGEKLVLQMLDETGPLGTQTLRIPRDARDRLLVRPALGERRAPSPHEFLLTDVPAVAETEPNDIPERANAAPQAPLAVQGFVGRRKDVDCFRFGTTRSAIYNVRVYARKFGSPLDTTARLYAPDGSLVGESDDSVSMDNIEADSTDSYIRFQATSEGPYTLCISGHLGAGGPLHAYRAEITDAQHWIHLYLRKQYQFAQDRMAMTVPRGGRFLTMAAVRRGGHDEEIVFELGNLPSGVTVDHGTFPPGVAAVPVVFKAEPDAPLEGTLATFTGGNEAGNIRAEYTQPIEVSVGMPAYTPYCTHHVDRIPVAVTERLPFDVRLVPPRAPLPRDGRLELQVEIERRDGFEGYVEIQFPFLPPGMEAMPSITLLPGETRGRYVVTANDTAATGTWRVAVLAMGEVGGAKVWTCSELVPLEIADRFVEGELRLAAISAGRQGRQVCRLDVKNPFEGPARLRLIGLPSGVTAEELVITNDSRKVEFELHSRPDCRPGRTNVLFCEATIEQGGEPTVQIIGRGGVLRVDPPRPDDGDDHALEGLGRLEQLRIGYLRRGAATETDGRSEDRNGNED
jgi:hypothetical protein